MNNNILLTSIIFFSFKQIHSFEKQFYRCLNSSTHKEYPSSEETLFDQCNVWKDLSCCNEDISHRVHLLSAQNKSLYHFNYEQCPERSLSYECKEFFIHDLCFYQCSPYNLAWIINAPMRIRKERFYQIPLCQSECVAWFQACQYDYTCSDNWVKHFTWNTETGNQCLKHIPCSTFSDIFESATNFCEKVWDDSWKVVNDSVPCMKIRMETITQNKLVGIHYAKTYGYITDSTTSSLKITLNYVLLLQILHIVLK